MTQHPLRLFADYFQFYVADSEYGTDTGLIWDDVTVDRMLASAPDLIAVGTARNMDVPVTIEILDHEPPLDLDAWEQVIDCAVAIPSGVIIALGCTDQLFDAARFDVTAGSYAARVSYAGLQSLSDDGLDGDDRYRVQLWPGAARDVTVLKRRPEE